MLPVEIKTTERNVPQGNNNSGEISVPKYLEGVVPRIFKKNKEKTRPVDAKFTTNAKVWKHSLDLSGYKPEEIQVNCSGANTVSVSAEKRCGGGMHVRRTVFVPRGVDMCNISSFVSDDGRLVIQAPYLRMAPADSCVKCSLKRKHSEYSGNSQGTNNHAKKARQEPIDITNGTDGRSDSEDAEADARHERGLVSSPPPLVGNPRQEEITQPNVSTDSPQESPSINSSRDKIESHSQSAKPHSDPASSHRSQVTPNSPPSAKESPESPSSTVQSPNPVSKVIGLREGSDVSYRDIGHLPAVRRQSVVLSVPIDNFFPDRDDIVISLQGNTLTIKATRLRRVKNCELSEMFLKELVFPSRFDCRSIRLAKDPRGTLIVSVEKNE